MASARSFRQSWLNSKRGVAVLDRNTIAQECCMRISVHFEMLRERHMPQISGWIRLEAKA